MEIFGLLVFFLFFEYICDFILQSRKIAENKSKDIGALGLHLACFGLLLIPIMMAGYAFPVAFKFVVMYAGFHGLVDMFLWKFYKKSAEKRNITEYWNDKEFYDFIGLDRFLHVATFILLFKVYLI